MNSLIGQALKSFLFSNIKFIRDMKVLIYDFSGVYANVSVCIKTDVERK